MHKTKQQVTTFHHHIGARIASNPELLPCDRNQASQTAQLMRELLASVKSYARPEDELHARLCLAIEELAEWVEAHVDANLVAAADAWGDRHYVLMGDAVATGLPVESIFEAVHRSNMSKEPSADDAGKGVKGNDFAPPNFHSDLAAEEDKSSPDSTV